MKRTGIDTFVMCCTLPLVLAALGGCARDTLAPTHESSSGTAPSSVARLDGSVSFGLELDSEPGRTGDGQHRVQVSIHGVESLEAVHFGIETSGDLRPLGWQTRGDALESDQGEWPQNGSRKMIAWPKSLTFEEPGGVVIGYLTVSGSTGQVRVTGTDGERISLVTDGRLVSAAAGTPRAVARF